MQQFQPLWANLYDQTGHACYIAARLVQVSDEPKPDRVASQFEDDRNCGGRRLCHEYRRSSDRSYDSHTTFNQIRRHRGQPINLLLRPVVFDRNILADDIAELL